MLQIIVRIRKTLEHRLSDIDSAERNLATAPGFIQFPVFLLLVLARVALQLLSFLISIPFHLLLTPQRGFQVLAPRDDDGQYLASYTHHIREHRVAVGSVVISLLLAGIQLSILGFGLVELVRPIQVQAYSTTVTLNPSWDRSAKTRDVYDASGTCIPVSTTYDCESATALTLDVGRLNGAANCDAFQAGNDDRWRAAMKFDLSSIPNNATIADADLTVNVSTTTSETIEIFRVSTDTPDTVSCTIGGSSLYEKLSESSNYLTTSNWNTTGSKTYDLGATADSDIQSRLTGTDLIAIGVRKATPNNVGKVDSVDSTNDPQLVITYTLPPQAPTNTSHSANTTSSITWTWTDNATADASNRVHDASHAAVCTTGAASGTGSMVSCTESTGLSANTQYTRHPNVLDADGNTDGPTASAYTSIENATGVTFGTVTTSSITVSASGSFSNQAVGSSGVIIQNTGDLTNSGWLTNTVTWTESGLGPNVAYSYRAWSRNGDGDETNPSGTSQKYTLSTAPNVASSRTPSTWYNTAAFPFTNNELWGAGGVQYYRYAWNQRSTHSFDGTESTWSNQNANCPGGSCTDVGTTLSKTASANGNNWYLHVQSFNGDGVANGSVDYGPYFFDSAAPTISSFSAATTSSSSTLTWTTNEAATTQIEWGTTASYGNTTTLDSSLVTSHSVQLTGLAANTAFHARARSTDAAGNTATSSDLAFTTSAAAATVITNVQVTKNSSTSVTVTWTTNEPATSKVRYGLSTNYGSEVSDLTLKTSHSLTIIGLTPNTTYHYEVISTGTTTDNDADATFTTPVETVVTTISEVRVIAGETIVTFFWTTNEAATSKVRYGTSSSYASVKSSSTTAISHQVQIKGLTAGTLYHFQLESVGSTTATTSDDTFTTNTLESTKNRAIGPTIITTTLADGANPTLKIAGVTKGDRTLYVYVDDKIAVTVAVTGDAAKTKSFVSEVPLKNLKSGKHALYVQAVDAVGRTSMVRQRLTFTIGGTRSQASVVVGATATYTVKPGDSLWRIAERFLGDGQRYAELVTTNAQNFPSLTTHPGLIRIGWTLKIPAGQP